VQWPDHPDLPRYVVVQRIAAGNGDGTDNGDAANALHPQALCQRQKLIVRVYKFVKVMGINCSGRPKPQRRNPPAQRDCCANSGAGKNFTRISQTANPFTFCDRRFRDTAPQAPAVLTFDCRRPTGNRDKRTAPAATPATGARTRKQTC